MENLELKKLKMAVKSIANNNDTFYMQGIDFVCKWKEGKFQWTTPSKDICFLSAKEVIKYIGKGEYITNYYYSYGEL